MIHDKSLIDEARLQDFMGKMLNDLGAANSGALVLLGTRLGLYRALAEGGPATSAELAERTQLPERYVREWLSNQAASGYVHYDPAGHRFHMSPEQIMALADADSPVYLASAYHLTASLYMDEEKVAEAFRAGRGVGWHEHSECLFCGVEQFFRTGYRAHLVQEWLPALDGVTARLAAGAKVADIGCGHGASTLIMAQAFPNSRFVGLDYHAASIERAKEAAAAAGSPANLAFETATAKDSPGADYDLVTVFDALHDMGDPVGAARRVREMLKPDGTFMIVEPAAGDSLEENMNPVGRLYYAASTMICTPGSLAQEVGLGLGAQAGPKRLTEVLNEAGFTRVRVATQTPFNLILEARP
jgi:2-polyprenyl-3-methyl-5-hydroxy-6-metoxy-1,4-benzoquinol methylase